MKTDEEIRADVMGLLDAIPAVSPDDVVVEVDDGTVTLSGKVDSHQTRFQVERVVKRMPGKQALVTRLAPRRPILRKPQKAD